MLCSYVRTIVTPDLLIECLLSLTTIRDILPPLQNELNT